MKIMNYFYSFFPSSLFFLALFSLSNELNAQVGNGFENLTTTQNCTTTGCLYIDSGNASTSHVLADAAGIPVSSPSSGAILGFTSSFRPTRTGSSSTGLTDGDIFGYAAGTAATSVGTGPAEGSQVLFAEDTDGEVTITFDAVDLSGAVSPMFSMQYIIDGSFENTNGANDRLYIRLEVTGCGAPVTLSLVDSDGGGSGGGGGGDMDNLATDKVWNTITQDLSAYVGCQVQLIIEVDLDSASEETAFDAVNFSSGSVLPVDLVDFTARQKEEKVALNWVTDLEINNRGFVVERSTDGRVFNPIAWVDGAGDTVEKTEYQFEDKEVKAGHAYYYRLRQEDFDGDFEYSAVVNVSLKASKETATISEFYPNPANSGQTTINLNLEEANDYQFTVMAQDGRVLSAKRYALTAGFNQVEFDLSSYAAGVYFVRVEGNESIVYRRVVR